MDINNLTNAKKLIEIELIQNVNSKDELRSVYQTRLSFIFADIESLIKIVNDPIKYKQMIKRCNPDK